MNGILEFKSVLAGTVEDVDFKNKIVTGYASAFGNKDHDRDIILHGAFAKTIREKGPNGDNSIFFLSQHNWSKPLGKPSLLEERTKGLYYESKVDVGTTYSEDMLKCMAAGLVIENSIGFVTTKETWVNPNGEWDNDTYREISEVKLYEFSAVTLGANSDTPFTGFKSLTLTQQSDQISKIVKLLRDGTLTDEGFIRLEIALKTIQKSAFELGQHTPLKPNEPGGDTTRKEDKPEVVSFEKALYNSLKTLN